MVDMNQEDPHLVEISVNLLNYNSASGEYI